MNLIERIKLRLKGRRDNKQFIHGREVQKSIDSVIIKNKDKQLNKFIDQKIKLIEAYSHTLDALMQLENENVIEHLSTTKASQKRKYIIDTAIYRTKKMLKGLEK